MYFELNILPTKYYYCNFNYKRGDCIEANFRSNIDNELKNIPILSGVLDTILKALCYIHNKKYQESFDKEICSYLYYWIGDALFTSFNDDALFTKVINILYVVLQNTNDTKICVPIYREIKDAFNKIKMIYDFSKDYEKYKIELSNADITCNANYKN